MARRKPPEALYFPVRIPGWFVASPGPVPVPVTAAGKPDPSYKQPYRARWGGGFTAPRGPRKLKHHAVDIMAPEGALVVAPVSGQLSTGVSEKGGIHAFLTADDGYVWYFAHLSYVVEEGRVHGGDGIGCVGRTGNATRYRKDGSPYGRPHLHLSLTSPGGRKVDPVPVLKNLPGAPKGPYPK